MKMYRFSNKIHVEKKLSKDSDDWDYATYTHVYDASVSGLC